MEILCGSGCLGMRVYMFVDNEIAFNKMTNRVYCYTYCYDIIKHNANNKVLLCNCTNCMSHKHK